MPKEKRKIIISNKKSVPLYQRLAMQAKIEAERESKEKVRQRHSLNQPLVLHVTHGYCEVMENSVTGLILVIASAGCVTL